MLTQIYSDLTNPNIAIPGLMETIAGTNLDYNYTITPTPFLENREIAYPRGKVLGGTTSMNFLVRILTLVLAGISHLHEVVASQ